MHNQNLGKLGEQIASKHLSQKGFSIIEFNFRANYGEIDIVAKDANELVFVEVKTRVGDYYGAPVEAISKRKLFEVIKTAQYYLLKKNLSVDWRVDVVAISLNEDETINEIEHLENVTL